MAIDANTSSTPRVMSEVQTSTNGNSSAWIGIVTPDAMIQISAPTTITAGAIRFDSSAPVMNATRGDATRRISCPFCWSPSVPFRIDMLISCQTISPTIANTA